MRNLTEGILQSFLNIVRHKIDVTIRNEQSRDTGNVRHKIDGAIRNEQSRDIGNVRHKIDTGRKQTKH